MNGTMAPGGATAKEKVINNEVATTNIVDSDFVGKVIIGESKFSSKFTKKYPEDGYLWKRKWNNKSDRSKKKAFYTCAAVKNGENCKAVKAIFTSFVKRQTVIEYVSSHSICVTKSWQKDDEEQRENEDAGSGTQATDTDDLIPADVIEEEEDISFQVEQLLNNSDHDCSVNDNLFENSRAKETNSVSPTPEDGVRGDGAPGHGVPGHGVPGHGVPEVGAPGDGAPGDGAPGDGEPGDGAAGDRPQNGVPEDGPEDGVPGDRELEDSATVTGEIEDESSMHFLFIYFEYALIVLFYCHSPTETKSHITIF